MYWQAQAAKAHTGFGRKTLKNGTNVFYEPLPTRYRMGITIPARQRLDPVTDRAAYIKTSTIHTKDLDVTDRPRYTKASAIHTKETLMWLTAPTTLKPV